MNVLILHLPPCCYISLSYIMGFDIKINHRRTQTTHSHASYSYDCNYCDYHNIDHALFHNVTCYTNPPLSHFHVNTANLLNTTCTLVATRMILGRLECSTHIMLWLCPCFYHIPQVDSKLGNFFPITN